MSRQETAHGPPVRRLSEWSEERLRAVADRYGTPLYVVDLDRVAANYRRFDAAFPEARVMYAAKANTGRAVLETVLAAGGEIECAARGELQRAVAAGADPNELRYTAVNPPAADLDYATALAADHPGLTITAGARDTFDRLAERGFDGRAAIRVNPGIGTGHHEKVATGKDAKFGIPSDEVVAVAREVAAEFDLVGLHAHVGSGVLHDDLDDHCRAMTTVADLAREVEMAVGELSFVDFGGGFGVPYRPETTPLDLDHVATRVREAVGDLGPRVELEPGRYVAADAGTILTRVNTVKESPDGDGDRGRRLAGDVRPSGDVRRLPPDPERLRAQPAVSPRLGRWALLYVRGRVLYGPSGRRAGAWRPVGRR
ncbi:MAG: Diaminopimelate decarboxylase [halophilic archaeon J07HB67]|nr:MAG: Diaminopimelate decarboxylase [halophilic archaeon J07HB67]